MKMLFDYNILEQVEGYENITFGKPIITVDGGSCKRKGDEIKVFTSCEEFFIRSQNISPHSPQKPCMGEPKLSKPSQWSISIGPLPHIEDGQGGTTMAA